MENTAEQVTEQEKLAFIFEVFVFSGLVVLVVALLMLVVYVAVETLAPWGRNTLKFRSYDRTWDQYLRTAMDLDMVALRTYGSGTYGSGTYSDTEVEIGGLYRVYISGSRAGTEDAGRIEGVGKDLPDVLTRRPHPKTVKLLQRRMEQLQIAAVTAPFKGALPYDDFGLGGK